MSAEAPARVRTSWLIAVLIGAALLRFAGLDWGLPGAHHFISLHPDEYRLVDPVVRSLASGTVSPETFHYGSLGFDLLWLSGKSAQGFGFEPSSTDLLVFGRLWSATLGVATVGLVFLLGRRLGGPRVGLLAATCLALAPAHVQHSHFATVDATGTFFVVLAIWAAARAGPKTIGVLLAGASAGLAAATKYPAGLVLLVVLALVGFESPRLEAINSRNLWQRLRWRRIAAACAAAGFAFLAAMPYVFHEWALFHEHVRYELLEHPRAGHGMQFEGTGNGLLYLLRVNLPWAFTWPATLAALAGLVSLARGGRVERALLVFVLPMGLALCLSNVRFMRYTMMLLPLLSLSAAVFVERLRLAAVGRRALTTAVLVPMLLGSAMIVSTMLRPDPRQRAQDWIERSIPAGDSIGLPAEPHFQLPNLIAFDKAPALDTDPKAARDLFRDQVRRGRTRWQFVLCESWNAEPLIEQRPDWFVLSEFNWETPERRAVPKYLRFMELLDAGWERVQTFESLPVAWRRLFGAQATPHDALYTFPQVRIYRRRSAEARPASSE